jgi:uncharacterized protein YjbI with pentapeptide repeats
LEGIDLSNLDLSGIENGRTDLSGANLRDANLTNVNLFAANMGEAILRGANLAHAKLRAFLYRADLTNADLSFTDLHGAILHGANLRGANLTNADLSEANLEGVTGINLEELKKQAKLQDTTMPDGSMYPGATTPKSSSSKQPREQTQGKEGRPLTREEAPSSPISVTIDLTSFPLVNSVAALCAAIEAGGKGVLRFPSLTYGEVYRNLYKQLEKRYGPNSRQSEDMMSSLLICAGCLWEFPGSYRLSLQIRGPAVTFGGTPGFDRFGESGICPQCGSRESLLVYEYFPAEQISMSDVSAIRRYWQQLARTWWQSQQRQQAFCDDCNTAIARNQGYLSGSSLICEGCVTRGLMTEGLEKLKGDSHYYGAALLRKARHSGATTPKSSSSEQPREQTQDKEGKPLTREDILLLQLGSSGTLDLSGRNLAGTDLSRLDLHGANLSGANLSGAILEGANLGGATLRFADLSRAIVSQQQLNQAYLLTGATMPDGTVHP